MDDVDRYNFCNLSIKSQREKSKFLLRKTGGLKHVFADNKGYNTGRISIDNIEL